MKCISKTDHVTYDKLCISVNCIQSTKTFTKTIKKKRRVKKNKDQNERVSNRTTMQEAEIQRHCIIILCASYDQWYYSTMTCSNNLIINIKVIRGSQFKPWYGLQDFLKQKRTFEFLPGLLLQNVLKCKPLEFLLVKCTVFYN